MSDKQALLDAIAEEIAGHLPCEVEICNEATNLVPGEGDPEADVVLVPEAKITRAHGRVIETERWRVFPMFHPAAALRNQDLRPVLHEDARALRAAL